MNQQWLIAAIVVAGIVSAGLYLRRRQWLDALLVIVAAASLGLFALDLRIPGEGGRTLAIDPAAPPASLEGVNSLTLKGDGLRAAEWNDLPARPLAWEAPRGGALRLEFPSQVALGRQFTLTVKREDKTDARLQAAGREWPAACRSARHRRPARRLDAAGGRARRAQGAAA
jgi:hypothetical protein